METITTLVETNFGPVSPVQIKLGVSALVILGLLLLRWAALWLINHRTHDLVRRYRGHKFVQYGTLAIGLIWISRIWFTEFGSIATYLGILSAGVAVALSDMLSNLAGWLFIIWRRPFEMGDRIEIGDVAGDVVDMGFFQFTLVEIRNWVDADQSTGRLLMVPNRKVFLDAIANFTHGFPYIWHEIPVLVTFESDWERAKALLLEITQRHAGYIVEEADQKRRQANRKIMIKFGKLTPIIYTSVDPSGVTLTIRFLTGPRRRRGLTAAIWEDTLRAFALEPKIEFAYPTQRIYADWIERPSAAANHHRLSNHQNGG